MIWDRDDDIFEDYYKNELNTLDHYDNMSLNVSAPAIYDGPPRLVVLLNHKPTDKPEKTSFEKVDIEAVNQVLEWVSNRLEKGLGDIWSQDPNTKKDNYGTNEAEFPGSDPEEQWARQVSEMFFGVRYGGPGPLQAPMDPNRVISGKERYFWENKMFEKICPAYEKIDSENKNTEENSMNKKEIDDSYGLRTTNHDPGYSIVVACEQLATYGILTRGFDYKKDLGGSNIPCSSAAGKPIFTGQGSWKTGKKTTQATTAYELGVTPGSVLTFKPPGVGQPPGSHAVFVLRTENNKKTGRKLQFFDTSDKFPNQQGAEILLKSATHSLVYHLRSTESAYSGIMDGNFTSDYGGSADCCGLGILPPVKNLDQTVSFLKKARPVGLARLMITTKRLGHEPEKLIYMSRLLRMYREDSEQNYSIARYIWSLRNIPGYESLNAWWIVYHPKNELAYLMWFSPKGRQETLSSIQRYFDQIHKEKLKKNRHEKKLSIDDMIQPVGIVCTAHENIFPNVSFKQCSYWRRWHSLADPNKKDAPKQGNTLPSCINFETVISKKPWHSYYLSDDFPKDENVTVTCSTGDDDICSNDILNKAKVLHVAGIAPTEPDYFRDEDYVPEEEVKS